MPRCRRAWKGRQEMAVSRTPAPADYGPAVPAADRATGGPPYPPVAIPGTDRALWARVIRHARCTGSSLDPDQWFPISVEVDRARREANPRGLRVGRSDVPGVLPAQCPHADARKAHIAQGYSRWSFHGMWTGPAGSVTVSDGRCQ